MFCESFKKEFDWQKLRSATIGKFILRRAPSPSFWCKNIIFTILSKTAATL